MGNSVSFCFLYEAHRSNYNGTAKDKWKGSKESRQGPKEHLKGWQEA
jgi:hypothetical protein